LGRVTLARVKIRLASGNEHKLRELRALLPEWDLDALEAEGMPEETGGTFYENARAKALFGRQVGPADEWILGEDSGLEVDGLGGGPGIRSARYAGEGATDEENVAKLLAELADVHGDDRRARYVSELVCIAPDGQELRGSGALEGRIAYEPRGSAGFGYDPVFVPAGAERTVAQLGDDWKRAYSHRARAARALEAAVGAARSAL
jgi:XTP/dITP diphosphohydrolase